MRNVIAYLFLWLPAAIVLHQNPVAAAPLERWSCVDRAIDRCTVVAQAPSVTQHPTGKPEDQRVQLHSDQWPWLAIGRINTILSASRREACTGTVIGPRLVLTAAHCVFNTLMNDWAKPESVHFLIGQPDDRNFIHSVATGLVASQTINLKMENRPRHDALAPDMVQQDWAILSMHDALNVMPVPIRPMRASVLPRPGVTEEVALAGYRQDHQYVLSVQKGCSAMIDFPVTGSLAHSCNATPGESGAPILLLNGGKVELIGIQSSIVEQFPPAGPPTLTGRGVSAFQFETATAGMSLQ
jgi:protease YdgD